MFGSALSLAWREIRHNPLRSGLTTLGIIIGVAAVIILVTLGNGATARVTSDISQLGENLLILWPSTDSDSGPPVPGTPFRIEDAEAISEQINGIKALTPVASRPVNAVYSTRSHGSTILGTDNAFFPARNYSVASGRMFNEGELRSGRPVCIIGETVREQLFGQQSALGAKIRIGLVACEVIGIMTEKGGSSFGGDQDDMILAPIRMVQRRISGNRDVNFIFVSAAREEDTPRVQRDIEAILRERRGIEGTEEDDFVIRDLKEVSEIVTTTTSILTAFLGAIAAISLFVGGIGIMNIMLVSVTERTREIGIRLAIGALGRDVLYQFLIEAVVLSVLGGVIGAVIGLAVSAIAAQVLDIPFVISTPIIVLALGFSAAVGMIFGFFPARRAARLDPIESLRYE